ncbi:MAG: hypothetical protein JNK63_02535 [Chthonomonas sp.]|nr:hypothetical protein [Chthonomonas sp.]
MLLIQVAAAFLVWAYHNLANVQDLARAIGESKTKGGLPAAFLAGFIAGAVVAEAAKLVTKRATFNGVRLLWVGFVYGVVGILIDLLYRFQAHWFGHGTDIGTLTTKMLVDMLIFSPFLSFPFASAMFGWWKAGFKSSFWKRALTWAYYRDEVLPTLPLGWAFWVPMVYLTYSLPLALQFPFSMLAEAAWCVLFVFMVAGE